MEGGVAWPAHPEAVRIQDQTAERIATRCAGGRVVWRCWGEGRPVVLIHGAFGSWTHWLKTIPPLAAHRRVIAVDMPGFGDSDLPASDDLLEAIPAALCGGLRSILAGSSFDLVAFSFGTVMAGQLAAKIGECEGLPRIDHFVLVSPAGLGVALSDFTSVMRQRPHMTDQDVQAMHRHNLGIMMFARPDAIDDLAVQIQIANVARSRVRGRPYSRSGALAAAFLAVTARKVTALWGTEDAYSRRNLVEYEAAVARLRPDIRIERVAGAGHWVQYEAADAFNTALLRLLSA